MLVVALAPGGVEIDLDLGFESLNENAARTLTGDIVEVEYKLPARLGVVYRPLRCTLPCSPRSRVRYITFLRESSIHNFRAYLVKPSLRALDGSVRDAST